MGSNIEIKVVYMSRHLTITIDNHATFGDLKQIVAPETGLLPGDLQLLFRGRKRADSETLAAAGVKWGAKFMLFATEEYRNRKTQEFASQEQVSEAELVARARIAEIRQDVDKLETQVKEAERLLSGGQMVGERDLAMLGELLVQKLLKLDGIAAEGEARVERKAEVHRVEALAQAVDDLTETAASLSSARGKPPGSNRSPASSPAPAAAPAPGPQVGGALLSSFPSAPVASSAGPFSQTLDTTLAGGFFAAPAGTAFLPVSDLQPRVGFPPSAAAPRMAGFAPPGGRPGPPFSLHMPELPGPPYPGHLHNYALPPPPWADTSSSGGSLPPYLSGGQPAVPVLGAPYPAFPVAGSPMPPFSGQSPASQVGQQAASTPGAVQGTSSQPWTSEALALLPTSTSAQGAPSPPGRPSPAPFPAGTPSFPFNVPSPLSESQALHPSSESSRAPPLSAQAPFPATAPSQPSIVGQEPDLANRAGWHLPSPSAQLPPPGEPAPAPPERQNAHAASSQLYPSVYGTAGSHASPPSSFQQQQAQDMLVQAFTSPTPPSQQQAHPHASSSGAELPVSYASNPVDPASQEPGITPTPPATPAQPLSTSTAAPYSVAVGGPQQGGALNPAAALPASSSEPAGPEHAPAAEHSMPSPPAAPVTAAQAPSQRESRPHAGWLVPPPTREPRMAKARSASGHGPRAGQGASAGDVQPAGGGQGLAQDARDGRKVVQEPVTGSNSVVAEHQQADVQTEGIRKGAAQQAEAQQPPAQQLPPPLLVAPPSAPSPLPAALVQDPHLASVLGLQGGVAQLALIVPTPVAPALNIDYTQAFPRQQQQPPLASTTSAFPPRRVEPKFLQQNLFTGLHTMTTAAVPRPPPAASPSASALPSASGSSRVRTGGGLQVEDLRPAKVASNRGGADTASLRPAIGTSSVGRQEDGQDLMAGGGVAISGSPIGVAAGAGPASPVEARGMGAITSSQLVMSSQDASRTRPRKSSQDSLGGSEGGTDGDSGAGKAEKQGARVEKRGWVAGSGGLPSPPTEERTSPIPGASTAAGPRPAKQSAALQQVNLAGLAKSSVLGLSSAIPSRAQSRGPRTSLASSAAAAAAAQAAAATADGRAGPVAADAHPSGTGLSGAPVKESGQGATSATVDVGLLMGLEQLAVGALSSADQSGEVGQEGSSSSPLMQAGKGDRKGASRVAERQAGTLASVGAGADATGLAHGRRDPGAGKVTPRGSDSRAPGPVLQGAGGGSSDSSGDGGASSGKPVAVNSDLASILGPSALSAEVPAPVQDGSFGDGEGRGSKLGDVGTSTAGSAALTMEGEPSKVAPEVSEFAAGDSRGGDGGGEVVNGGPQELPFLPTPKPAVPASPGLSSRSGPSVTAGSRGRPGVSTSTVVGSGQGLSVALPGGSVAPSSSLQPMVKAEVEHKSSGREAGGGSPAGAKSVSPAVRPSSYPQLVSGGARGLVMGTSGANSRVGPGGGQVAAGWGSTEAGQQRPQGGGSSQRQVGGSRQQTPAPGLLGGSAPGLQGSQKMWGQVGQWQQQEQLMQPTGQLQQPPVMLEAPVMQQFPQMPQAPWQTGGPWGPWQAQTGPSYQWQQPSSREWGQVGTGAGEGSLAGPNQRLPAAPAQWQQPARQAGSWQPTAGQWAPRPWGQQQQQLGMPGQPANQWQYAQGPLRPEVPPPWAQPQHGPAYAAPPSAPPAAFGGPGEQPYAMPPGGFAGQPGNNSGGQAPRAPFAQGSWQLGQGQALHPPPWA